MPLSDFELRLSPNETLVSALGLTALGSPQQSTTVVRPGFDPHRPA
ncbi:MAG: hypothetical protein ACI82F_003215 [Planctomycetota bacterium]|jgi:hypothetical protein